MAETIVAVGSLRWPVIIARRPQLFDAPGGVGIYEDYIAIETVRANIQPIGALTFYGAQQIDTPVTHWITTRWLDYIDNTNVIIRSTRRPDGSERREFFRVRRIKELNGRKRFVGIEAELEKVAEQSAGSAQ